MQFSAVMTGYVDRPLRTAGRWDRVQGPPPRRRQNGVVAAEGYLDVIFQTWGNEARTDSRATLLHALLSVLAMTHPAQCTALG